MSIFFWSACEQYKRKATDRQLLSLHSTAARKYDSRFKTQAQFQAKSSLHHVKFLGQRAAAVCYRAKNPGSPFADEADLEEPGRANAPGMQLHLRLHQWHTAAPLLSASHAYMNGPPAKAPRARLLRSAAATSAPSWMRCTSICGTLKSSS